MKRFSVLAIGLLSFVSSSYAATLDTLKAKDTLDISIVELEGMFLQKNFVLLAQKYNIEMSEAAIRQARFLPNPYVTYENVLYNPNNHRWLDNSYNGGERMAQIQQLILLGGKRSKLVKQAEANKNLQTYAFYDLLRVLKFQLYSDYALVYGDLKKLALLRQEHEKLKELLDIFKLQYKLGAVAGYELTRIEFETQTIQVNIAELLSEILDAEARLKMLVQLSSDKFINPTELPVKDTGVPDYAIIVDSAISNRPDLKVAGAQIDYSQRSLDLERARAIPDVTLGTTYDRVGNNFRNYFGINAGFNLPVFNRNQGNIKIAELQVKSAVAGSENNRLQVYQDVDEAYNKLNNIKQIVLEINPEYHQNLSSIADEAIKKYNQRVISLLDFIDKMRTYKNGQLNLIDLNSNYFLAQQYINFVSNTLFY